MCSSTESNVKTGHLFCEMQTRQSEIFINLQQKGVNAYEWKFVIFVVMFAFIVPHNAIAVCDLGEW